MLFGQNKKDEGKEKKRSVLGLLFNPEIGKDVGPIVESARMFVRMIAMILASNKLFPKDHLVLRDEKAPLTFGQLFAISFNRLSFTKEGIPQIILFVAVWGVLLFSILFVVTFVFSLFVGNAQAGTPTSDSMFVPASPENDLALNWIDYVFLGKDYTVTLPDGSGVPKGGVWQKALGAALAFYSTGILVLGGFLLVYHLASMIAETAHSGKPMGNANQIWAPIRLVFAIGLLIPIGTGSVSGTGVSGLNTGQYIVVQMAKWGSGLATNTWKVFVDSITPSGTASCEQGSPSCIQVPSSVEGIAAQMIRNYLCVYTYNYYLNGKKWTSSDKYSLSAPTSGSSGNHLFGSSGGDGWFSSAPDKRLCGGYFIPAVPQKSPYAEVYEEQNKVFAQKLISFQKTAITIAQYYAGETKGVDVAKLVKADAESYRTNLNTEVQSALKGADQKAANEKSTNKTFLFVKTAGWLTAGAWFNNIARSQEERTISVTAGMPSPLEGPLVLEENFASDQRTDEEWEDLAGGGIATAAERTAAVMRAYSKSTSLTAGDTEVTFSKAIANETSKGGLLSLLRSAPSALVAVATWTYTALVSYNIATKSGGMAFKFNSELNPIQEVAQFGHNLLLVSLSMFGVALGLFIAGIHPTLAGIGLIGGLVASLALPFFTAGAMLGYMLPLVPFFRFFFGALTWLIGLFEAVVAMPLFALAHLNPEGAGLPGGAARGGYFLILNVFLRPILMIFGLIAGYLVFIVGLSLLNMVFFLAFDGVGAISDTNLALGVLSYIVMSFIYAGAVYTLGNNCFKSIGMFPQYALRWVGQSGHHETMGNPQQTQQAMAAAGSYILGKMVGETGKVPGEFARERRGLADKQTQEREKKEAQKTAALERRQDLYTRGYDPDKIDPQTGMPAKRLQNSSQGGGGGGVGPVLAPGFNLGGSAGGLPPPSGSGGSGSSGGSSGTQQPEEDDNKKTNMSKAEARRLQRSARRGKFPGGGSGRRNT